jgi:carbon-monoxide dehydrogenase small subunit
VTALTLTVNGGRVETEVEPRMHLADMLRERLNLTGTHLGCEQGACGACTVLLNGAPVRSCVTFAVTCQDAEIRTIEGFEDDPVMARLRDAFSREHGLQCGFCTPGMLVTARDIVTRLPGADATRVRRELSGNLCRCTGYVGIVRAVTQVAAEQMAAPAAQAPAPRAAPRRFTVAPGVTALAAPVKPAAPAGVLEPGWTRLTDSFAVAQPIDIVWAMFADLPRMIACMPGASLGPVEGPVLHGRMQVQLGPINAAFAGTAEVARDDAAKRGVVSGAGGDGKGRSRARGRVIYHLTQTADGAQTQVALTLEFVLQGALAQFGRSGLVKDLVGRLVRQFADNLARSLADPSHAAPAPASLGLAGMIWGAVTARIRAWFGRR